MKKRYNFTLSDKSASVLKAAADKSGLKMTTILEQLIIKYLSHENE